tara:strand:- start:1032 stop:1631 length:600 start_codon:yes stop_codon:yes gene_type:complete
MLPQISFSAHESCDSQNIVFTDTTGAYDPVTNTTGWGAPNFPLSVVQDAEINITDPSGTLYQLEWGIFGATLPNANNNSFMINMSMLGGTANTTMTQGLYNIEYRILVAEQGGAGTWITARKFVFCYSTIKCCVHKMLAALDICDDCPCDSEKQNALEAYTLYKAMLYASSCGSITKADKIFKQVSRLCNYKGPCNTCS